MNAIVSVEAGRSVRGAAQAAAVHATAAYAATHAAAAHAASAPWRLAALRAGVPAARACDDDPAVRAEKLILERCAAHIAAAAGAGANIVELGSGLGANTRVLMSALVAPAALRALDLSSPGPRARGQSAAGRTVVLVPGEALAPGAAAAGALLRRVAAWSGADALVVAGAMSCAARHHLPRFAALALAAGWAHCQYWADGQARYALHVLERSR